MTSVAAKSKFPKSMLPVLAVIAGMALSVPAQAQGYQPDIANFKGVQDALTFPPDDSLDISGGGTIEFWVAPGWTKDPGYDPVVVSNAGPQGASYLICVLRGRDGIGVLVGDQFVVAPYDLKDGKLHFVSVSDYGDSTMVLIDGKFVAQWPITFQQLPSSGFFIGTADGATAPFVGKLAALRIWDTPVTPDDLIAFAKRPVAGAGLEPHPDLDDLVGMSLFGKRTFALSDPKPVEAPELASGLPDDVAPVTETAVEAEVPK